MESKGRLRARAPIPQPPRREKVSFAPEKEVFTYSPAEPPEEVGKAFSAMDVPAPAASEPDGGVRSAVRFLTETPTGGLIFFIAFSIVVAMVVQYNRVSVTSQEVAKEGAVKDLKRIVDDERANETRRLHNQAAQAEQHIVNLHEMIKKNEMSAAELSKTYNETFKATPDESTNAPLPGTHGDDDSPPFEQAFLTPQSREKYRFDLVKRQKELIEERNELMKKLDGWRQFLQRTRDSIAAAAPSQPREAPQTTA